MSRVLTGGAVIAAAVAAGTAFTDTNTMEGGTVAGYGTTNVSGATVINTAYNPDGADISLLDTVVFTASGDLTATTTEATMVLRNGTGPIVATTTDCGAGALSGANTVFTCDVAPNYAFASFTGVDLTVVSQ